MAIQEEQYKDFSQRVWNKSIQQRKALKVQFEITYRCNLRCVHCYTDPFNTPFYLRQELTVDQMLRIFDELVEAGALWMCLTGGEASAHPHFKRIYREARARGFILSLFSNATLITEELADFLAEDPPFQIEVSCHGATEKTFDQVAQVPGSFQRFQEGIEKILKRALPLKIKTSAMTLNFGELRQIKEFAESLNVDFQMDPVIQPRLNKDLSSLQYRLSSREITELEYGNTLDLPEKEEGCGASGALLSEKDGFHPPPDDRLFRCGCGGNTVTVSPQGILRPCTLTPWPLYDLKTMHFKEAFENLVRTIHQSRYTGDSPCRTCTAYALCRKNPVMALEEAGSMEAPVPYFCDLAFSRRERIKEINHGSKSQS